MKCILAGATGLVGKSLLKVLLEDAHCTQITALIRSKIDVKHPKLKVQILDFEQLLKEDIELPYSTVGICCLGTTIAQAGSEDVFYKVDHDYVIAFARACLKAGVKKFIYVSALGADSNSTVYYNKVKGQVENDLSTLGFEKLVLLRPSLLLGERRDSRPLEFLAQKLSYAIRPLLFGHLKKYKPIEAGTVANKIKYLATSDKSLAAGVNVISNDALFE